MTIPYPPTGAQPTPPPYPTRTLPSGRVANVLAVIIAVIALVIAVIALVRPSSATSSKASPAPAASSTFTPEQVASAKKVLCSAYQLAAHSVDVDTHGSSAALARVALANAAGMLDAAAANPALSANDRDAAWALASAYRTSNAVSSGTDASSPLYQRTVNDVNRADDAMAAICR